MKRKTANIDIRVEPQLVERIDAWRARYGVIAGYCMSKSYLRVQLDNGPKKPVRVHVDLLQPV